MALELSKTVPEVAYYLSAQLTPEKVKEIKTLKNVDLEFDLRSYIQDTFQPYIGKNEDLILSCIEYDGINVEDIKNKLCYMLVMKQYEGDRCSEIILQFIKERYDQLF